MDSSFFPGSTGDGLVQALAPLPNGGAYLGGSFTTFEGVAAEQMVRLTPAGTVDPTFSTGTGFSRLVTNSTLVNSFGRVSGVAVQADGKLLVGGDFNLVNGSSRNRFARLNPDGTVDAAYDPAPRADGTITGFLLQTNQQCLVWGNFTNFWGLRRPVLARLNADGSLDSGFNCRVLDGESSPSTMALQFDGKVLVGGYYPALGKLFRLMADGSLDSGFHQQTGTNSTIRRLAVQPDGKILVVGSFTDAAVPNPRLCRLLPDGAVDPGFRPGLDVYSSGLVLLQPDGKVLVDAGVTTGNSTSSGLLRLQADGSVDPTFGVNGLVSVDFPLSALALQPNGSILIAGNYITLVGGTPHRKWAQLDSFGNPNPALSAQSGITPAPILRLCATTNHQLLLVGGFTSVQGSPRPGIARLNADGRLDTLYVPSIKPLTTSSGPPTAFNQVVAWPDGPAVVFGSFRTNLTIGNTFTLARLRSDGQLDTGYHTPALQYASGGLPSYTLSSVRLACPLPNGALLLGDAGLDFIDGYAVYRLGKLQSNGQVDTSFHLAPEFIDQTIDGYSYHLSELTALALTPEGKIIAAGSFTGGPYRVLLARLNSDGSLDPSLPVVAFGYPILGGGIGGSTSTALLCFAQADGRILVGGDFINVNGVPRPANGALVRIGTDGSLDPSFNPQANAAIACIAQQPNGKLVVAGAFGEISGVPRRCVARLNLDGTVDPLFDPGPGPYPGTITRDGPNHLYGLTLQDDGRILVAGTFSMFDRFVADNVVRLFGGESIRPLAPALLGSSASFPGDGSFRLCISTARGQRVVVEAASSLAPTDWHPLQTNVASSDRLWFTDPAPAGPRRFYRACTTPAP